MDTFPESVVAAGQALGGGQRTVTVLLYLNEVEEGGETVFSALGCSDEDSGGQQPRLAITAAAGKLLCFHDCLPGTVTPDPRTLHAGCPVLRGEKWCINKWFRAEQARLPC
eukprot:SAG22_NODE_13291_length_411_cov_1.073718_1_plen_110_part_10